MPAEFHHIPVLFNETIDSLNIVPGGVYVDCTAGGGGHSSAILERLGEGRLIAVDRDPEAIATLGARFGGDPRVTLVHDNFFNIKAILSSLGIEGMSAADAVNDLPQHELQRIIYEYGEEKFAPAISRAIVRAREQKRIETTLELAEIIKSAMPAAAKRDGHPARRTFQAIRIYINGELDGLSQAVTDMFDCLDKGGRVSIITFHSLEDRIVKQAFAPLAKGCICPRNFPVCVCGRVPQAKVLKAVAPSEAETAENPRSRSARLRTAEKL